jgi:4-hydroxy-3-polyprenylbenzoate decarboxylase
MIPDLRQFLDHLETLGDLRRVSDAALKFEIGAISELAFEKSGPALLFDRIEGYPPNFRIAVNVCSTQRRSLLGVGMDPNTRELEAMNNWRARWDGYRPIPPKIVAGGAVLENVQTGADVDLMKFPVPIWHELDGGPYIGTGLAVILKDPDQGWVNLGSYRLQRHDRNTTGFFCEPENDGAAIVRKYWKQGKAAPVAVSLSPEPIIFLTASGSTGCPPGVPEYDFAGFIMGEPIEVIEGPVTGLPISARAEIAVEGEVLPPQVETRPEGPFGEWTGYYAPGGVPEPVLRVKSLYHRNDPILFGAPPFKPHRDAYSFSLPMRTVTRLGDRLLKAGLPVRRVTDTVKMGAVVISVHQQSEHDVTNIMKVIDKVKPPSRLFILVDDDVNPEDPLEVLWAIGTRFDPITGVRVSVTQSAWLLDPLRTTEQRAGHGPQPYKRLIINGCRPFDRLKDFPTVNKISDARRKETWEKWKMAEWLSK